MPAAAATLQSNAVRLGASWKLAQDTSLYGQFSTGSDPVTSILSMNLANSRFKLTGARQVEAGVKGIVGGGRAEWTAALYRIGIVMMDVPYPELSEQERMAWLAPLNPALVRTDAGARGVGRLFSGSCA